MRRRRHAAVEQASKGGARTASFAERGEPQQGGRPNVVLYPVNSCLHRWGGHKHTLSAHRCRCQGWIDVGEHYLFPTDELGGSRQLVFIANDAGVATKEVEVDKNRVVRTVGLHVQGQQDKLAKGADREIVVSNVSSNLAGDRQIMTGAPSKIRAPLPLVAMAAPDANPGSAWIGIAL